MWQTAADVAGAVDEVTTFLGYNLSALKDNPYFTLSICLLVFAQGLNAAEVLENL